MKSRFTFLGMEWDMDHQQMGINSDRLSPILSWHCPPSITELSSHFSYLQYYESNCPFLKRIAYPIYDMVKKNEFQWTRIQSHAWGNILFQMALSRKNQLYNPKYPLIMLTDSNYIDTISNWLSSDVEVISSQLHKEGSHQYIKRLMVCIVL